MSITILLRYRAIASKAVHLLFGQLDDDDDDDDEL